MASDVRPRVTLPAYFLRGGTTVAELPVYVDSTLTAPSAGGTFSLVRPDGTKAVDTQTVTITASVATYSVTLASTETPGEGWACVWSLTVGGVAYTFRQDAACVLTVYRCGVSTVDLERRHPELAGQYPTGHTNWEPAIEEADLTVQRYLMEKGRRPCLILSPWSTHRPTQLYALAYAFRMCVTYSTENSRFQALADKYEAEARLALESMVLTYDENEDAHPDASEQGQTGSPVIFLSAPPHVGQDYRRYWRQR